jgi:aspartyl/asparaginyl beta-hydroxylase (cupin superfamily)
MDQTATLPSPSTSAIREASLPSPAMESVPPARKPRRFRLVKKTVKRIAVLAVFVVLPLVFGIYVIPVAFGIYFILGLLDVMRNKRRTLATLDRYFFGNGFFTWLLAPFNLLLDLLCLPYRNKGVYELSDLPKGHQEEITAVIDAARMRDLLPQLEGKMGTTKRAMIFFKWYGKNLPTSLDVPEFHQKFKYIRTIGVSIFNKRSSTGKHYGPLRISLRVLYNINNVEGKSAYIRVGNHTHYWSEKKLFIFDDTLQHRSVNETDGLRACLFVDILRPTPWPRLTGALLTGVRLLMAPARAIFYQHWTFVK